MTLLPPPPSAGTCTALESWVGKGCVYLYVSPVRAFLLPDGQADAGDEALWRCLTEHLAGRCRDT